MSEVDKHLHPENATASSSSLSPICAQFPELKGLMEGNRIWAKGCKEEMPDLLPKLATGQVCLLLPPTIISLLYQSEGNTGDWEWNGRRLKLMIGTKNPLDWMCRLQSPRNINHLLKARRYLCSRTSLIHALFVTRLINRGTLLIRYLRSLGRKKCG